MALLVNKEYIKVEYISTNMANISIITHSFKNKDKQEFIKGNSYLLTGTISEDITTKQAYEYLKTIEEFKDAEDC